ncbi:alpha/beta fold hydrolase [Paraburkholderia flava]|uniref:alpha/beta fold hydrolase n=1 Tax=Paraburkholderia flava TaxID=2547393 RepID=UPI001061D667|nr:alpha/beta fold hydrolase [Paraburkholderia flava]
MTTTRARSTASKTSAGTKNAKASAQASQTAAPKETPERTADNVLGQNLLGDFRPSDLWGTASKLTSRAITRPFALLDATLGFWSTLGKVATGSTRLATEPGDRRFTDEAWEHSTLYSGLLQSYLALRKSMTDYAQISQLDERAQFLLSQIGDAVAPSNFLLGNPKALRRARETNGMSLLRGAGNLLGDIRQRRPIPSQVDEKAFEVGGNLAMTPGSVVLRTEMFELIQYAPQTPQVHRRPLLVVPSIVNKYYIFDLAPGRSILEYYVQNGFTVFVMVWRNPQKRHDRWGMPDYQDAIDTAIDTSCAISGSDDVNLWAVCGAGPVAVSMAGYYAATKQRKINSLLLVVSPLDMTALSSAPTIGALMDQQSSASRKGGLMKKAQRSRRISAREFTLLFAMLRSNELIWSYWVNNYLMGETPAAFDVMYWNGDGTGMTAQFNHDFSAVVESNPFVTDGAMIVRDTPIADVADLDIDSYVLGAKNDHLCVWQSVYRSAQLLGPRSQFVLGNSGHVQTIVCPPDNPKASFSTGSDLSGTPEQWLEKSTRHSGSWWAHGVEWTRERAGELVDAPAQPGNDAFPPLCPAPGTYVHERG